MPVAAAQHDFACCSWLHGFSRRRRPRPPARLGNLASLGAASRSPPVPSGPSGALQTCGAWPLCVPVGGSPPARSPHASLTARSGRSRGPPWPCRRPPAPRPGPPAPRPGAVACSASHPGYRALITEPTANFACNSPTILSNCEIRLLELQCFQTLLKLHSIELCASFLRGGRIDACWWCSGIPQARCAVVWNR